MTRRNVDMTPERRRSLERTFRRGIGRMMRLFVLGSGSRGNCFAVETEGVALLLDAGFSAREIERRAESSGLELGRVAGDRPDARARRPRVGRTAAGPAPANAGAHRARDLGSARAADAGGDAPRPRPPERDRGGAVPRPGLSDQPRCRRARWRSRCGRRTAPASASPTTSGAPPPPCATCCASLTALVLEANHDEVAAPDQRLPAGGAAPDRRLGRPPVQPCRGRAAGRAAPSRARGGGAGPPEPAVQHGGRRARRPSPRRSGARASAASCTWPRRMCRCRRSTWRCRSARSSDWRCRRTPPRRNPGIGGGMRDNAARDPLGPGSAAEWIPRCVAGPTDSGLPHFVMSAEWL